MPIVLEVSVESVESAVAAQAGGAERIELCSVLDQGGITPSAGLIHAVRSAVSLEICVLIRPRPGDFCYTDHEFQIMRDDLLRARDLGVDSAVLGILLPDHSVDVERTAALVLACSPMPVTFHRAFDVSRDLDQALEDVISAGARRLLTSGGQPKAIQGAHRLAALRKSAGDRLTILGGGGIRASNVRELLQITGLSEIHSSLSRPGAGGDTRTQTFFGASSRYFVDSADVLEMRRALDSVAAL